MSHVTRSQAQELIGRQIYAVRKDGSLVTGKLFRINGNELSLSPIDDNKASTKAILPLALFDLLAIGTLPFGGFGFGGFGGFGFDGFW